MKKNCYAIVRGSFLKVRGKEADDMREFLKKYRYIIITVFFIVAMLTAAFFSTGYLENAPAAQSENSTLESLLQDDIAESGPLDNAEFANETVSEYVPSDTGEDTSSESSERIVANTSSVSQNVSSVEPGGNAAIQSEAPPQSQSQPENAGQTDNNNQLTCTFSISCETIQSNLDKLRPNKIGIIPSDGWIQRPVMVTFREGESVFDVLKRVCQENGIHLEFSWTPIYNSAYIEGIYNLYEFDCGSLSGWMYSVNGLFPNYSCSAYSLKNGDVVAWQYSCSYGDDIGGRNVLGR